MQVPFDSIKQQVWDEIRHGMKLSNHTESFWENVQAFAHAVDWKERWMAGILACHVLVFLAVVLFRRNTTFLGIMFCVLGAAVFLGERLNALAGDHWEAFAGQDYFDSHGIFYSIVVSGPAVVNLFAVLIFYLIEVTSLMVVVKKKELLHKAKERAKAEAAAGDCSSKKQQ
ncbi:transmembrane protein 18-domain-containing protein [Scenedesmus sp. NREL 46B-D3]|nr:transmembrane protein 18-domain-containing protein [Scenedesmus sp. NREL 46B-D3]